MENKTIVGVMGPGADKATDADLELAKDIGAYIAANDAVVLCGGMQGVMEAVAEGAHTAGGMVIGLSPTKDKADMNEHVNIRLATGMHAGRNYLNAISADMLVFISVGSPGTLSELAHAIQEEVPSIIINASPALQTYVQELGAQNCTFVEEFNELQAALKTLLQGR